MDGYRPLATSPEQAPRELIEVDAEQYRQLVEINEAARRYLTGPTPARWDALRDRVLAYYGMR